MQECCIWPCSMGWNWVDLHPVGTPLQIVSFVVLTLFLVFVLRWFIFRNCRQFGQLALRSPPFIRIVNDSQFWFVFVRVLISYLGSLSSGRRLGCLSGSRCLGCLNRLSSLGRLRSSRLSCAGNLCSLRYVSGCGRLSRLCCLSGCGSLIIK